MAKNNNCILYQTLLAYLIFYKKINKINIYYYRDLKIVVDFRKLIY